MSCHVCLFPWTSHLFPPGSLLGTKSDHHMRISRVPTCPPGLSDSRAAEHPEIQDRSTARWGGDLYSMLALYLMSPEIVRPAVQMIYLCTACPVRFRGVWSGWHAQKV